MRGLPPRDILPDVVRAWQSAGLDVAECLQRATTVTNEWVYTPGTGDVRERFAPRLISERTVPVAWRDLYEVISPQPKALDVIRRLLEWIGSCDAASQRGGDRPAFETSDGLAIFPEEEKWWLTDVQQRKKPDDVKQQADEDGPVSECDDQKDETDDEDPTSKNSEEDVGENTACAAEYKAARAQWAGGSER